MNIYTQFGRHKARYSPSVNKSATHGKLLLDNVPIYTNLPFALLQYKKSKRIAEGINKNRMKIIAITL